MIARLWLPAQAAASRLHAIPLLIAFVAIQGLVRAFAPPDSAHTLLMRWATQLTLCIGGVGFAFVLAGRRGDYAFASGTAFVWVAIQFVAIGTLPNINFLWPLLLCAFSVTLLLIPASSMLRSGSVSAGLGGASSPIVVSGRERWAWCDPVTPDIILLVVLLVISSAFALIAPEIESLKPAAAAINGGFLWRVAGWAVCYFAWRQSIRDGTIFVLALAPAIVLTREWFGGMSAWMAGLSLCLPVAIQHRHDRGSGWVPVAVLANLLMAAAVSTGELAGVIVAVCTGFAVCASITVQRRRRGPDTESRKRDNSGAVNAHTELAGTRRALHSLLPYDRWYGLAKLRSDPLYATLATSSRPWGRILDVGCGMGLVGAIAARKHAVSYTGIDLDPDKIRVAAQLLSISLPSSGSATLHHSAFPFPGSEHTEADGASDTHTAESILYDTVFVLDALHYAPPEEQHEMLASALESLAPNGRLVIREAVANSDGAGAVEAGERWTTFFGLNPRGRTYFMSRDEWAEVFELAGAQVVSEAPCGAENVLFTLARSEAHNDTPRSSGS